MKYAIRNKECRNAVWIDFICNKQARANCERAKGKGVFKFRKLKNYLEFSEIFLENLSIINPAGFPT